MRLKSVYMDNGATTKPDPKVVEKMMPYITDKYGNPSSTHSYGIDAKEALENARDVIAKSINAKSDEIFFTSGGTESNNWVIKGVKGHIITTKIEHKCILNSCKWMESRGVRVTYLDVDSEGFVNPEDLDKAITKDTVLVSIIHGNNEVGTIQDLRALSVVCKKHNVLFHTDACQSYTKTELDVKKMGLDLVTINSHKLHGPRGVGALYVRRGVKLDTLMHGGGQELGRRCGTENVAGIVGFAEAVKVAGPKHVEYMTKLCEKLIEGILSIPDVRLNGPRGSARLCNNANFSFKKIEGEAIGGYLNQKLVCSSTGSACSEKTLEPSYVLTAMGLSHEDANGSLRLTLSRFNADEEVDYVLEVLPKIVDKLRGLSPIGKVIKSVFKKNTK